MLKNSLIRSSEVRFSSLDLYYQSIYLFDFLSLYLILYNEYFYNLNFNLNMHELDILVGQIQRKQEYESMGMVQAHQNHGRKKGQR
jgi:hypothetical protein